MFEKDWEILDEERYRRRIREERIRIGRRTRDKDRAEWKGKARSGRDGGRSRVLNEYRRNRTIGDRLVNESSRVTPLFTTVSR